MISEYLGIDSDYIVIGLAALVLILIIVMIVNAAKMPVSYTHLDVYKRQIQRITESVEKKLLKT